MALAQLVNGHAMDYILDSPREQHERSSIELIMV